MRQVGVGRMLGRMKRACVARWGGGGVDSEDDAGIGLAVGEGTM